MARTKIRFYSSIHKSKSIFYRVSWKYIPLPACCTIIDKYRFRQRGNRERQQTSMLLLWWTASTVRFSMSMCSACDVATSPAVGVCWKKKWTSKKEIVAERTREWEMSSGGSDICIHFLSFSEGRERRKGGVVAVQRGGWRKQVQDEGLSGGYKGAVHWERAREPSMGLKNTQTKLGKEEGMPYNATGPHAWFKEPVRKT